MGLQAPSALRAFSPAIIIVHGECLTCVVGAEDKLKLWLAHPRFINVFSAKSKGVYLPIIEQMAGARYCFLAQSDFESLRPSFSPRAYRFDRYGRLDHVQTIPFQDDNHLRSWISENLE
jgi:hypothetical protein